MCGAWSPDSDFAREGKPLPKTHRDFALHPYPGPANEAWVQGMAAASREIPSPTLTPLPTAQGENFLLGLLGSYTRRRRGAPRTTRGSLQNPEGPPGHRDRTKRGAPPVFPCVANLRASFFFSFCNIPPPFALLPHPPPPALASGLQKQRAIKKKKKKNRAHTQTHTSGDRGELERRRREAGGRRQRGGSNGSGKQAGSLANPPPAPHRLVSPGGGARSRASRWSGARSRQRAWPENGGAAKRPADWKKNAERWRRG